MRTYAPTDLHGFLNGGLPQVGVAALTGKDAEKTLAQVRQMAALHERVAMLEMTRHEFLDQNHRVERTTFADGTTVTVDWDAGTVSVKP